MELLSSRLTAVINELIKSRKIWNRTAFAEKMGTSPGYVSKMEKGGKPFTESFAKKIVAEFPSVNYKYFIDGTEPPVFNRAEEMKKFNKK